MGRQTGWGYDGCWVGERLEDEARLLRGPICANRQFDNQQLVREMNQDQSSIGTTGTSQGVSDWAYPHPVQPGPFDFSLVLLQYYTLQKTNSSLYDHLSTLKKEREDLLQENENLRRLRSQKQLKQKRRYSKRRQWLEKTFSCEHHKCNGKYSSRIALNNHLRKKHPELTTQE